MTKCRAVYKEWVEGSYYIEYYSNKLEKWVPLYTKHRLFSSVKECVNFVENYYNIMNEYVEKLKKKISKHITQYFETDMDLETLSEKFESILKSDDLNYEDVMKRIEGY